jgi:hypothetical protein
MYEHKLSNFEKAFLTIVKEHKEDEKEDAILAEEIKNILLQGGIDEDNLENVITSIMEKVQAHCDKMSEDARDQAYSAGKEAGLDAAYHSQH